MPWLEIVTDDGERVTHVLREREVVVGRHPTCDIVLRDTTISRRHARVYCDGPDFYVEDLGSQHGTKVNEDRLTKSWKLVDQDEIHILDARLVFHSLGSP
jgi:pSer/pThr/pTyr-binding forkhead associated (FHA) protein